jgi:hypothetical protein
MCINTAAPVKSLRTHNISVSNDKHNFYFDETLVNYNHLRKNKRIQQEKLGKFQQQSCVELTVPKN